MNVIWKFPLEDNETEIDAHIVEFLTVQMRGGTPCVWAVVDPNRVPRKYKISILESDWEYQKIDVSKYIGTIQSDMFVGHCFWDEIPIRKSIKEPAFAMFSKQVLQ